MAKKLLLFTAVFVLVLSGLFLYGCQSSTAGNTQQQGIYVTGEGKVEVTPDIANVQLGIDAQADTVAIAQSQANSAMTKVMAALKTNGVADEDIQTRYFSIQKVTRWDSDTQQEVTIGYRVSNIVSIKIRDIDVNIDKVGAIIDAVTLAGGDLTRVDSISFDVDDPIHFYDLAREKAMADANDKAARLAELANVKLGKATYINEYNASTGTTVPIYAKAEGGASDTTQISAGQLEITLQIQVVYSIR